MDVLFAVMPFADVNRPAIGVSLLKAGVERRGLTARVEYFNLDLAELVGFDAYDRFANGFSTETLAGEWFFADAVFGNSIPHEREFAFKVLSKTARPEEINGPLAAARARRFEFVEACAGRIRELKPRVVGFTTTFHQTCACLAVARRLKGGPDPPVVVFGGANCQGEMGWQLLQSFPWVDYVCAGEGDVAFPDFLEQILRGDADADVPGILRRGEPLSTPEPVRDMDSLPVPDYGDYVARVRASTVKDRLSSVLLIETARGCWWGAKQHCTFCGLNGDTMAFRSKSPERALEEFKHLAETYGYKRIDSVDNILDMRYLQTVFPGLEESGLDLELFYEVKANLRYEQLAEMRAGGMRMIQPGIESFSDEVLRLMRKGCTGLQNVQLLRWCEELGVTVAWNILAGFPDETPAEYERMAELLPLLTHLTPPTGCSPVRLDRFSPFYTRPEEFGMRRVRPKPAYYYVFPLGRTELARLAYFFDFDYGDGRDPESYLGPLRREVSRWYEQQLGAQPEERARLDAFEEGDEVLIKDTRAVAVRPEHRLDGLAARLYLLCDSAQTPAALQRRLGGEHGADEIRARLDELVASKLTVEVRGQYLSLAVWRNRPAADNDGRQHAYGKLQQTTPSLPLLHLV